MDRKLSPAAVYIILIILTPILEAESRANPICLWEVAGLSNRVLLMGSIHLLSQNDYPLDTRLNDAFDQTEVLVLESDLRLTQRLKFHEFMMEEGILDEGNSLKTILETEELKKLEQSLGRLGLSLSQINNLKPWLAATVLTTYSLIQSGFDMELGIDQYFFTHALADEREIFGLESPEIPIKALSRMPLNQQKYYLLQSLNEIELAEEEMEILIAAWKTGNTDDLKLLTRELAVYPVLYNELITKRNMRWLETIQSYFNIDKNVLIIAGAGHFPGEEGLLNLLIDAGWEINQVR